MNVALVSDYKPLSAFRDWISCLSLSFLALLSSLILRCYPTLRMCVHANLCSTWTEMMYTCVQGGWRMGVDALLESITFIWQGRLRPLLPGCLHGNTRTGEFLWYPHWTHPVGALSKALAGGGGFIPCLVNCVPVWVFPFGALQLWKDLRMTTIPSGSAVTTTFGYRTVSFCFSKAKLSNYVFATAWC